MSPKQIYTYIGSQNKEHALPMWAFHISTSTDSRNKLMNIMYTLNSITLYSYKYCLFRAKRVLTHVV